LQRVNADNHFLKFNINYDTSYIDFQMYLMKRPLCYLKIIPSLEETPLSCGGGSLGLLKEKEEKEDEGIESFYCAIRFLWVGGGFLSVGC